MQFDWDRLEGAEATERILRAACQCEASQIHLSCDNTGGTIFFSNGETIEFFDHIPLQCRNRVRRFFKTLAGIDAFTVAPAWGGGVLTLDGKSYGFEVKLLKGSLEDDLTITLQGGCG